MSYLGYLVFLRAQVLWGKRNLPSVRLDLDCGICTWMTNLQYLGPSMPQLAFLFILMIANFLTCFAVGVMFLRSLWSLWMNITSIESWEIERHEALVRRARRSGGYVDGPNGIRMRIVKQEFPYDIGIWSNLTQGMGQNPLAWLWPLAQTPRNEDGLHFDVNGFEGPVIQQPLRQMHADAAQIRLPRGLHPIPTKCREGSDRLTARTASCRGWTARQTRSASTSFVSAKRLTCADEGMCMLLCPTFRRHKRARTRRPKPMWRMTQA